MAIPVAIGYPDETTATAAPLEAHGLAVDPITQQRTAASDSLDREPGR